MKNIKLKECHNTKWAEIALDFILQSNQITIGQESQLIYIDNKPTDVQVSSFCIIWNKQKKLSRCIFKNLVSSPTWAWSRLKYLRQVNIGKLWERTRFFPNAAKSTNGTRYFKKNHNGKREGKQNDKPKKAKQKKGLVSSSERTILDQLCSRGPALFANSKRLQKQCKLSLAKVKSYLDNKPSLKKYWSVRMQLPRLKVIVKDIKQFGHKV